VEGVSRPGRTDLDDFEQIVADADTEAHEAAELATALEERVKDGDETVTPAELENARQLRGFAKLRQEAAARKAAKAREAERQRQLAELKAEILQEPNEVKAELAELLHTAEDALMAFADRAAEHNGRVTVWHQRMMALGVPTPQAPVPLAEHARMGWRGDGNMLGPVALLVGYPVQTIEAISAEPLIGAVLGRLSAAHRIAVTQIPGMDPYAVLGEQA
jgi:hypothetical protein